MEEPRRTHALCQHRIRSLFMTCSEQRFAAKLCSCEPGADVEIAVGR